MASSSVFNLTRFTALASGDVIPVVDISDTTQSAHGSLLSITVANFFNLVPVGASTFGATIVPPALVSGIAGAGGVFAFTPDVATNVARRTALLVVGFGAGPVIDCVRSGGTVTAPTAVGSGVQIGTFSAGGYDGTSWLGGSGLLHQTAEAWTSTAHGTFVYIQTTPTGSVTNETALAFKTTVTGNTRLVPGSVSLVFANNADNADNLKITDAGAGTFRSTVKATSYLPTNSGSIANNATFTVGTPAGIFLIYDTVTTAGAIIVARGTNAPVILVQDALAQYTTTQGSVNKCNVYVTGGNLTLENKEGGPTNWDLTRIAN